MKKQSADPGKSLTGKRSQEKKVQNLYRHPESEAMLHHQWEHPDPGKHGTNEATYEKTWQAIEKEINTNPATRGSRTFPSGKVWRYAAIFLLPVAGFLLGTQLQENQGLFSAQHIYQNPRGVRSEIFLPDRTRVTLAPDSRIRVADEYGEDTRTIHLEGKAQFDVTEDSHHPFVVTTPEVKVEALGTIFYVNASNLKTTAGLIKGRIRLHAIESPSQSITLLPDEKVEFLENSFQEKRKLTTGDHAWSEGKLVFEGATLREICKELETWYDTDIHVSNELGISHAFHLTIQDENLDEILHLLSMAAPISCHKQKNGSYKIRKK